MKKKIHFLLFVFILLASNRLLAQEEVYDQPVKILDTLNENNTSRQKDKKSDNKNEDAKTDAEKRKEKLDRIRVGLGNFVFQFGAFTVIQATPTIGYMAIKDRLEIGGGPILMYQRIRYTNNFAQSFFVYGLDIYARGYVYKGAYLETRYDLVNKPSNSDANKRLYVNHLLIGGGYVQRLGKIGYFNGSLLFNVLNSDESIHRGTFGNFPMILNLGFSFGLGGR